MAFLNLNEIDITVNSAVEGKIRRGWIDCFVRGVISSYIYAATVLYVFCNINSEGGISALMGGDKLIVDADFSF